MLPSEWLASGSHFSEDNILTRNLCKTLFILPNWLVPASRLEAHWPQISWRKFYRKKKKSTSHIVPPTNPKRSPMGPWLSSSVGHWHGTPRLPVWFQSGHIHVSTNHRGLPHLSLVPSGCPLLSTLCGWLKGIDIHLTPGLLAFLIYPGGPRSHCHSWCSRWMKIQPVDLAKGWALPLSSQYQPFFLWSFAGFYHSTVTIY